MHPVPVAVVQAGSIAFDRERTLTKAEELIAEAAGGGAKLVVFPEAFVGGYPKGLDFGARVGGRTPEGRRMFRRYFESCGRCAGPGGTERWARRRGSTHLSGDRSDRTRGRNALLHRSVLLARRRAAGKHRKLMPTAMERVVWGFGDGSTLPVLDTPLGKLGAVICWENYMPLLRTAMYAKGIQLYCAPTVDDRETWVPSMRHIAIEGRCFVLSACSTCHARAFRRIIDRSERRDPGRADSRRQRHRESAGNACWPARATTENAF